MRISFLSRSLNRGGAERQLVLLARGLAERGHHVEVAVFYDGGPLAQALSGSQVQLHELGKRGRWDLLGFSRRLIAYLRSCRADVFHGYLIAPNLSLSVLKPLLGDARVLWGVRASDMHLDRYDLLSRVTFSLGCALARHADLIISNSNAGRRYHVDCGYPAARTITIPNGIDTEAFRPNPEARRRLREEWAIPDSTPLIGLVGRLDPMKDHATFLNAAQRLARVHPDVRFVCVGDGKPEFRDPLVSRTRDLGLESRLLWAGARQEMPSVFNALDLVTSSSAFGEGFPNVLGEAMASGVPCVATDVGDSRAILGGLGWLVQPQRPDQIVRAWESWLAAPQRFPADKLRQRIAEHFSTTVLIDRTEQALQTAVNRPRGAVAILPAPPRGVGA